MSDVIDLDAVSVSLSGRPVVRDVDARIGTGEVVALVGANGSGKSTLVKAILGLNPTARGSVRLFGTPLRDFRQWSRVGYVPQRSTVAQGVPSTVWEVVSSGRLARRRPFVPVRGADREAVAAAIAAVGLSDRSRHTVRTLSGGQQQRVLMARALAGEPELLVLDEPNAGVDVVSQQHVAETLADRARAGATILVVLHELGPFEPLIGRVLVMREGRLVADESPEAAGFTHHGHHHPDTVPRVVRPDVQAPLEGA